MAISVLAEKRGTSSTYKLDSPQVTGGFCNSNWSLSTTCYSVLGGTLC